MKIKIIKTCSQIAVFGEGLSRVGGPEIRKFRQSTPIVQKIADFIFDDFLDPLFSQKWLKVPISGPLTRMESKSQKKAVLGTFW